MTRRGALRRLDRGLLRAEQGVLGAGILGIAAVSITNVLARNLLGGSLPFAEEVNQAFVLWITFAGVGLGARQARHIRMAAFYDQLRGRARKAAWMGIAAATAALLLALAALAVRYVVDVAHVGGVTPALRLPLAWVYAVVPAGLFLGAVEYGLTFARNLTSPGVHASYDLEEARLEEGLPQDAGRRATPADDAP